MTAPNAGWRLWSVVETTSGWALAAPFPEGRPDDRPAVVTGCLTPPAVCNRTPTCGGPAPAPSCVCGWYFTTTPAYPWTFGVLLDVPRVVSRVRAWGRVEPDTDEGVPAAWRAEQLRLVGPLWLNRAASSLAGIEANLTRHYGGVLVRPWPALLAVTR